MTMPWDTADELTTALFHVRMRGAFYCWTEAAGTAAVEMPQIDHTLSFHIVDTGTAYLEVDGAEPLRLDPGMLALVPRGLGHRISCRPGGAVLGRADELPQTMIGDSFSVLRIGSPDVDPDLRLLCGVVAFESPAVEGMLEVLPPVVTAASEEYPVARALLPLLREEMVSPRPGGSAMATRLADLLVIETVRAWIARDGSATGGWLAAARDPQLGRVVAAVQRAPGHPWSLGALASTARMSRTSFAVRFTEVVGVAPMTFVSQWRMRVGRGLLLRGDTVGAVASELGYGSEAAFSRAFQRITGETPGSIRRSGR
ncbi:AraC family transcriptional regulator [Microbacterium sp. ET2]|uniref:AraC family transcriptional regulator n=1 Tax=Microbacterium albipurpureum TaxID=3050384 RepID=UPI00259CDE05|nr:AraC family transcriptional regulator [Microbacterium sp. ET2 (Ac-2212)]WJL95263.1 AraC family transcriptional regulator [Microbacterium sp. ET2 (Ac-2212)]